ncbi:cation:proton antiporter [Streptomyces sp. NPDC000351]|uniref:cation:proton antiporter domain-containing protein n=1 Tax=Streptomyces sp. NPDC000351 TaxID=3154250 RepID=UPI003328C9CD
MPSNNELVMLFFVQLAVVLAACRLLGVLLRRLGQPQVVADMVAGFLLGPTLLGHVFPALFDDLFPQVVTVPGTGVDIQHPALATLFVAGQLGLVFYMFVVGMRFDHSILAGHVRQSAAASMVGVAAPLLVGGLLGWYLAGGDLWFAEDVAGWQAAVFLGASCAITAFPMLARIINERGLTRTKVGTLALACAAVDDAAAWILLAVVVAAVQGDPGVALLALGGSAAYVVLLLCVRRVAGDRFVRWGTGPAGVRPEALGAMVVVLLVCATFTEWVGVYSVFGAFLLGTCMPRGAFADEIGRRIEPVTNYVLVPLFFVYSGLNTRLDVVFEPAVLGTLLVVLVVAFAVKGGACALASRSAGSSWRDAASLGALMNARGLMELILLGIGRDAGLITVELYTVLALMTVITTVAATPLYEWISGRGTDPAATATPSGPRPAPGRADAPEPLPGRARSPQPVPARAGAPEPGPEEVLAPEPVPAAQIARR